MIGARDKGRGARSEGLRPRVQRFKGPREGRKPQVFLCKNLLTHLFAITAEIQGNGIEFAYKKRIYIISGSAVKSHCFNSQN